MKPISISSKSQHIMEQLKENSAESFQGLAAPARADDRTLTLTQLTAWLSVSNCPRKQRFQYQTLCAELLGDIHKAYAFQNDENQEDDDKPKTPWYKKALFGLLLISGISVAVCEGYDAVGSILGMFSAVPAIVIMATGLAFSVLSVSVFLGFDLLETAKNLDVPLNQARALLDVYLEQAAMIKTIRKTISENLLLHKYKDDDLAALQELSKLLKNQHKKLTEAGEQYQTSLDNPFLRGLKFMTAGATGLLYFGGGFFSGQAMAIAVAGFFIASVSPTCWPVIAVGVAIGLASFCGYWFVQRPGVENLVGRCFGLDHEKIETLQPEKMAVQKAKLKNLDTGINEAYSRQSGAQHKDCHQSRLAPVDRSGRRDVQLQAVNDSLVQTGHAFFTNSHLQRSKSMSDLHRLSEHSLIQPGNMAVYQ